MSLHYPDTKPYPDFAYAGGFVLKTKDMNYRDLTLEDIGNAIKGMEFPSMVNTKWEEDGEKYSSWTINTGGHSIITGDGGAELFRETIRKELFKDLEKE